MENKIVLAARYVVALRIPKHKMIPTALYPISAIISGGNYKLPILLF